MEPAGGHAGRAELVEAHPERALAIYAHPDDPDVSCGGTLARWSRAGTEVHVAIATRGDKGTMDPEAQPDGLAARREGEVAAAGAQIGVTGHHLLGHLDGELEDDRALRGELVALVRELRPEVVVCPDPEAALFGQEYLNHRDHRVIGWAALDAIAPAAALPLYFPGAGPPHQVEVVYLSGTLVPDVWIDVSDTIEVKVRAVLCHASQVGTPGSWAEEAVRRRAAEAGQSAGVRYAEAFRRLRLRG
jgi:LmbE family N-acetylglucosaminyl deacetylase